MAASVGIVIPSLNQGSFLSNAINSLLDQTAVRLNLALVDGGSTDQTPEILSSYREHFAYFRSSHDNGQGAAINEGASHLMSVDYVGWLNADDMLLPGGLESMANFLDHHLECVAVFGKAHVINEAGEIIGNYPTRPFKRRTFAIRCTICQPASLIRRSTWDEAGGVDESFRTCMDYDLWWRLSRMGKIGYLGQFVACSRDHAATKTRTLRKRVHEEAISILLKHRGGVPRNWCMANILEGLEEDVPSSVWKRRWKAIGRYIQINGWRALCPQNWLI